MKKLIIILFLFAVLTTGILIKESEKTSASEDISQLDSLKQINARMQFENGFYEGVIWAEQQYLVKLRTGNNDVFPVSSKMVNEELKRRREQ